MDKKLQTKLLYECTHGNFKLVSSLISKVNEFDECLAARVVVECCRVLCIRNSACAVIEEDLHNLLRKCVPFIKNLDENLLTGFLQSMYYIIKFFIEKKNFKAITEMEDMMVPKFMNSKNSIKITKLYVALFSIMHNTLVDLLQSENHKNDQILQQFCMLSLKMKLIAVPNIVPLASTAYAYFKMFNCIDLELQYDSYIKILHLIKTQDANCKETFNALIIILEIVFKNLFKQNEFNKLKEYIKILIIQLEELREMQPYSEFCKILNCVRKLIIDLRDTKEIADLLKNNFEICFKSLKHLSKDYSVTEELQKTCSFLYVVFSLLLKSYSNTESKIWNVCMIKQTQISLCKLLAGIAQIISTTETKCVICSQCKITRGFYTSVCATTLIGKVLQKSLSHDAFTYKSLAPYILQYLESCCEFIKILKAAECKGWKSSWSEIAILIYNIAVTLYSYKYNECNNYYLILIKNVLLLEGASSSVFKFNVISTSLKCLSELYLQADHYKKALVFAAVQILLSDDTERKFQSWVSAKNKSKRKNIPDDNLLQEVTIVCILEENRDEIKDFYPDIDNELDDIVKQKLLIIELTQYKALWPSRLPMKAAFKKLFEIADTLILVKVLIQIWGEDCNTAHEEVLELLSDIIVKLKLIIKESNKDKVEMHIYLASLYVMYYYSETKKVKQKVVQEMSKIVVTEDLAVLPQEIPKNPNDECDLISSYESLRLDEHLKIWKYLNKALRIFNVYVPCCTSPLLIDVLKKYNVFNSIVKIAEEALLHYHSFHSIQAWFIGLSLSRLLCNKLYMLQSLSSLIEQPNMNTETVEKLLVEAEEVESEIQTLDLSSEYWEVLTVYHISKSKVFLHNQRFEEGFEEYKQALNCFTNVTNNELLKIRLDFLHVQYLHLPCNLNIEGHDIFALAKFSAVFIDMMTLMRNPDFHCTFTKAILLEVNQFVTEVYKWMCLPREVRCYSRNTMTYTQEEVVPLRAAHFLLYLAHADLLSARLDDCQVKLNGLSDILCLCNKKTIFSQNEIQNKNIVINKDEDMSNLIEDFAEIMLDLPANNACQRSLTGSPVLLAKPFKMPPNMNHVSECDCFYCISIEYKQLVMEYINLEAQVHIHCDNTTAAEACFNGALQLYKDMNDKNKTFKMKVIESLSCDPLCDIKDILCETFCGLLLNYVNNLLRMNNVVKAKSFNEQLVNLISERKYRNSYLYNEALTQKLVIMHFTLEEINEKQQNLQVDLNSITNEDNKEAPKTPENRQTKVVFPITYSPRTNSPPKRHLQKIKCDFSEKKANNKLPFSVHVSPGDKITNNVKFSDELEGDKSIKSSTKFIYKTPAPKITKKKVALQELPITPTENSNNCATEKDVSSVIPSSPNAYTPKAVMVSSVLQSRTKLLTKKLTKSTVKKCMKNDDNEKNDETGNSDIKDKNKTKRDVCKNLISELSAAENHTVKKCTNKKRNKEQDENTTETSRIPVSTRVTRARKNL